MVQNMMTYKVAKWWVKTDRKVGPKKEKRKGCFVDLWRENKAWKIGGGGGKKE